MEKTTNLDINTRNTKKTKTEIYKNKSDGRSEFLSDLSRTTTDCELGTGTSHRIRHFNILKPTNYNRHLERVVPEGELDKNLPNDHIITKYTNKKEKRKGNV